MATTIHSHEGAASPHLIRGDPAIEIAPPQGQARFAQHPGGAQALAAGTEIAAPETQQLGNRRRLALASFQGHQR